MSDLVLDRYALGLSPRWPEIILDICDLELNYIKNPRQRRILMLMLEGYSERQTASQLGLNPKQVQRELDKIRKERKSS
jgi:DNA-binding NarL/FixJ family response regulator